MSTEITFSIEGLAEAVVDKLVSRGVIVPRLLTAEQAATYLGLTKNALLTKVSRRQLGYVAIDANKRFDRMELDKLIAAKSVEAKG